MPAEQQVATNAPTNTMCASAMRLRMSEKVAQDEERVRALHARPEPNMMVAVGSLSAGGAISFALVIALPVGSGSGRQLEASAWSALFF